MRRLFVSFTSLMYGLDQGRVAADDLRDGLFAFRCSRDHALSPGSWGEYVEEIVVDRPDIHRQVEAALRAAEKDGRVAWRAGRNMTYEKVSALLVACGYPPIAGEDGRSINGPYCYPGVEDRVREAGIDLEVVR